MSQKQPVHVIVDHPPERKLAKIVGIMVIGYCVVRAYRGIANHRRERGKTMAELRPLYLVL